MGTAIKFDVIHFANNPDEWKAYKDDTQFEDKLKEIADYLEIQIKENFVNFNPSDIFKNDLYFNGSYEFGKGKAIYYYNYDFSTVGRKILKEFTFDGNWNRDITKGVKAEQNYKTDFIELYSFMQYYLGSTKMLISQTDIMVQILGKATSYNGFKNIKDLKRYKDNFELYSKEKKKAIGLMDENMELNKQNEEIKKQRGTINQYFPEWESETHDFKQGDKITFYKNEFILRHPELKNLPYKRFSSNYRKSKSNDKKAMSHKQEVEKV